MASTRKKDSELNISNNKKQITRWDQQNKPYKTIIIKIEEQTTKMGLELE